MRHFLQIDLRRALRLFGATTPSKVPGRGSPPRLSRKDLIRTVQIINRIFDLARNNDVENLEDWDSCVGCRVDTRLATDYSDGELRIAIGLETNSGIPNNVITPFGSIQVNQGGAINEAGNLWLLWDIKREFGAIYTNGSAVSDISHARSVGRVDSQLIVLTKDGDTNPLGTFIGVKDVAGFMRFSSSLVHDTPGILRGDPAEHQIRTILDYDALGLRSPHSVKDIGKPNVILLQAVEQSGVVLSGAGVNLLRQRITYEP